MMSPSKSLPLPDRTRRRFLQAGSLAAAGWLTPRALSAQAQPDAPSVIVEVGSATGAKVPADFLGLSYETMQMEDPAFFSPDNVALVQQFRNLSPRGVLRLGGNTVEFGWWQAMPESKAPDRPEPAWKPVGEPASGTVFAITPKAIVNLDGFLKATGWSCIYGLNLGQGTPEADAAEAAFVAKTLGPRLQYFAIGNEPDLFKGHLRDPATWSAEAYLAEWLAIAHAVAKAIPGAKFGMPDIAGDLTWLSTLAELWPQVEDKPALAALTHHYYWSGPPANPEASLANLMKADPKVAAKGASARAAATKLAVPFRMTEGNTVYRGGKSGVSDVLASALWSADYLLTLMDEGYCGANLHGGSGRAQSVSVGGADESQGKNPDAGSSGPVYTPIGGDGTLPGPDGKAAPRYKLQPAGAGMKFAAAFAGAAMLPVTLKAGRDVGDGTNAANVTAHAARRPDGKVIVALLNKEAATPVRILSPFFDTVQVLTGPALDAGEAHVNTVVSETASRRTAEGQIFTLPPHMATLIVLR